MQAIRRMPEVIEASIVAGGYDIVAKVTADKMEKLKEIVTWKIRRLEGVKTSLTLVSHKGDSA